MQSKAEGEVKKGPQDVPGSPTEAQVLPVTACPVGGPRSVGLAREGLEVLSGVHLSGENFRGYGSTPLPGL